MNTNDKVKSFMIGLGAMTEVLGEYRRMLRAKGFTRSESLKMCLGFQDSFIKTITSEKE